VGTLFAVTGVYAKGAAVLHMLRHVVGDSAFFRILRTYATDNRYYYGTASTADFRGVCESVSGRSLGWFFNEWIYGVSYPRYSLRWSAAGTGDANRVTATLSQTQQNTSPAVFQMPVDLRFSKGGTIDTTIVVFNTTSEETFTFSLPFRPDRGEVDPDQWILRDVLSPDPLLPQTAQIDQNFPNPFNGGTTITIRLPNRTHAAVCVYDLLGRRLATLSEGVLEPGKHPLRWEGRDDVGRPLASGVYFVRLETAASTVTRQLLLIR
jgi:aminopeptidase N